MENWHQDTADDIEDVEPISIIRQILPWPNLEALNGRVAHRVNYSCQEYDRKWISIHRLSIWVKLKTPTNVNIVDVEYEYGHLYHVNCRPYSMEVESKLTPLKVNQILYGLCLEHVKLLRPRADIKEWNVWVLENPILVNVLSYKS